MNPTEERIYEIAGLEIASKNVKAGLWTKAFAHSQGDEQRTKVIYIELRVEELREEYVADITRQIEADSDRRIREEPLIKERFSLLGHLPYQDVENIPRSQFSGNPSQLHHPVSATRVSEVTGLMIFEVADFIKRGEIDGVYCDDEWYCDLEVKANN